MIRLKHKVDKGVILAAGEGNRLGSLTDTCPKALVPVNGKEPLIKSPIDALAGAGIEQILVVVGYLGDKVIEELGDGSDFGVRLEYVSNSEYLGGNAISVYKARDWAEGNPVVLCMADHLIEPELVDCLLDREIINETLCIDYTPGQHHELDEATKVNIDGDGIIKDIGKELVDWDALDTGVFLLTEKFFQALHELQRRYGTSVEITDVIRFLVSQGHRFDTCDVSGCFWTDVDTPEDLNIAGRI